MVILCNCVLQKYKRTILKEYKWSRTPLRKGIIIEDEEVHDHTSVNKEEAERIHIENDSVQHVYVPVY